MVELPLEQLAKYHDNVLSEKYKKLRKAGKKITDDISDSIKIVSDEIDRLGKSLNTDKDDLVTRAALRFVTGMMTEFKKFQGIQNDKVTYATLKKVFDFLSSLFTIYNENGKKWVPKFSNQYKTEIKAIQTFMIRVFKMNGELDNFLRTKYEEAKEAEELIEKIKRLEEMIVKYKEDRKKIDDLDASLVQVKADLEKLEQQLIDMEHNPLVADEQRVFRTENTVKQQIQLELSKIKKSAKKFEKALDSGEIEPRFITKRDIKDYLRNLFDSLISDGPTYPKLHAILENLAGSLDDEIQLKDDKKEKAQDIITAIKDQQLLTPLIEEYLKAINDRKEIAKKIQEQGVAEKIGDIKQKISDLTTQRSHIEADLSHEKENVVNSLNKMKSQKETLEKEVKEISKEKITIMLAL